MWLTIITASYVGLLGLDTYIAWRAVDKLWMSVLCLVAIPLLQLIFVAVLWFALMELTYGSEANRETAYERQLGGNDVQVN